MEVKNREKTVKPKVRKITKSPTSFNVVLTQEQKDAKAIALANTITFFKGKPGTSKSLLCCHIALDLLIKGYVDKIIVTRPTVIASRDMGFLPGDAFDFKEGKMAPFLAPILQSMYKLRSRQEIDGMISNGRIEIVPIQFARGLNFENCVVIVDESQNITTDELKTITTRLSENCKMLFTSDVNQIDLQNKSSSGSKFIDMIAQLDEVAVVELKENFRHPLSLLIMDKIDENL